MAGGGDPSNAQFGILGLRDAASAGYLVDQITWKRSNDLWRRSQTGNGGWSYDGSAASTGSMTCAGIATLAITKRMMRNDKDVKPDGTIECCRRPAKDEQLEAGINWMARYFAVQGNPPNGRWALYYLYAMERAGRLTGRRFFGQHDWYRAGARHLANKQEKASGSWNAGGVEREVVGTSLALLFLSKGLSRVVVNKLEYGAPDANNARRTTSRDWNNHPDDVRNLVELISGLPDWPKLLTTQTVNMYQLQPQTAVAELSQAPICYISGAQRPTFTAQQVAALRAYVDNGGFILACATCDSQDFDPGFRDLVKRMFPEGAKMKRLGGDHPIFRAEYELPAETVELYGVDFGCRTPIVYSPVDVACYWNKWMKQEPPDRKDLPKKVQERLRTRITRDTRIGVNIVAYATGREPPIKLHDMESQKIAGENRIERGMLEIAKLKHSGGWDTAPKALRNLLLTINKTVGLAASTKPKAHAVMSEDIFNHPMLYMHGRNAFQFSRQEREQIRTYLKRGHVLFADACCGSRQFDQSFRSEMKEIFPNAEFKRIDIQHELFSDQIGYDIKRVKRRVPAVGRDAKFEAKTEITEPFLEGIEIVNEGETEGRLAVIYSKYDISCALERQATAACAGYTQEDATRIAMNVVLYALLQDVN